MNKIKEKIKYYDHQLDLFFEIPELEELGLVFGFASMCVFILVISGFFIKDLAGFALFGVVIFWLIWSEIQIYYRKKRENKPIHS